MRSNTIIAAFTLGLAAFSHASPLAKRAITVKTDGASASITPLVTSDVSFLDGLGPKADLADALSNIVLKVTNLIQKLVDADLARRRQFTQQVVSAGVETFPGKNIVMSNVDFSTNCVADVQQTVNYKAKVGSDVSYEVLVFGNGCSFTLNGDGGFENWAFNVLSACTVTGKTIAC